MVTENIKILGAVLNVVFPFVGIGQALNKEYHKMVGIWLMLFGLVILTFLFILPIIGIPALYIWSIVDVVNTDGAKETK